LTDNILEDNGAGANKENSSRSEVVASMKLWYSSIHQYRLSFSNLLMISEDKRPRPLVSGLRLFSPPALAGPRSLFAIREPLPFGLWSLICTIPYTKHAIVPLSLFPVPPPQRIVACAYLNARKRILMNLRLRRDINPAIQISTIIWTTLSTR
jgi:hypothetical protein